MKKLLSLLSVLTIGGTAVPTSIAASPYKKEESLNSNINLQTNNLKILKRNKRQNNNFPPNDFKGINISNNVNNYFIQLCDFITYLRENNIVRTIRGQVSSENNPISCGLDGHTPREDYFINTNTLYNHFKIPIILEENEQSRMIYLIFRSSDFYLQGFINNRNYYYFNDATIMNITDATSNNNLGFEGDYNNLMRVASVSGGSQNPQITWEGIQDAFFQLFNMGTSHQQRPPIIAASLIRVILATAESLRFRQVQNLIINSVNNSGIPGTPVYWNNFIEIIKNWLKWTKEAFNYLLSSGNLFNFPRITDILIFHSLISKNFNDCDKRNARDLNNNEEYCFTIPEKTFHWRDDKKIFEIMNYWWYWKENFWSKNFRIGLTNPKNYNRIEFLGDTYNSRISWGDTPYYADKFDDLEKADLSHYIKDNEGTCNKNNYNLKSWFDVQKLNETWEGASIEGKQTFGFCSYKEDNDFYLKIVIVQAATCHASSIGGALFLELGRGFRLYNE